MSDIRVEPTLTIAESLEGFQNQPHASSGARKRSERVPPPSPMRDGGSSFIPFSPCMLFRKGHGWGLDVTYVLEFRRVIASERRVD